MSVVCGKDNRALGYAAVVALLSTAVGAIPTMPVLTIRDVVVKIAPNTKVGKVRSGMLCTPNGDLRWYQVAMPTDDMVRDRVVAALRSAERTVLNDAKRPGMPVAENPIALDLSIDRATILVCLAWKGMGNAPKGKGSLTLTWHASTAATAASTVTVNEELVFDRRDPRIDSSVILDAIESSAIKYASTFDTKK